MENSDPGRDTVTVTVTGRCNSDPPLVQWFQEAIENNFVHIINGYWVIAACN